MLRSTDQGIAVPSGSAVFVCLGQLLAFSSPEPKGRHVSFASDYLA